METTQAKITAATVAADVAVELSKLTGEQWTAQKLTEENDWYVKLSNGTASFGIHASNWDKRFSISGDYPKNDSGGYMSPRAWLSAAEYTEAPSIGVANTATPERIAKEIKRRFLPVYLPILELCNARKAQQIQAHSDRDGAAQAIADAYGGMVTSQEWRNSGTKYIKVGKYAAEAGKEWGSGTFEILDADWVKFELRTSSLEVAKKLAAFLKSLEGN